MALMLLLTNCGNWGPTNSQGGKRGKVLVIKFQTNSDLSRKVMVEHPGEEVELSFTFMSHSCHGLCGPDSLGVSFAVDKWMQLALPPGITMRTT